MAKLHHPPDTDIMHLIEIYCMLTHKDPKELTQKEIDNFIEQGKANYYKHNHK